MDTPTRYDVSKLSRRVNAIPFMSKWQKELLIRLWKEEAAAGLRPVNLDQGVLMQTFYPAYMLQRVPDIFLSAFRAKGIRGARRFVVMPIKTIATIALEQPVSHGAVILALSARGAVLGALGFSHVDDLVTNSDPSDLKDDEVNVIVKMDSTKVREDGNAASFYDGKVVDQIKTAAPNKTIVIDLSAEAMGGGSGVNQIAAISEVLRTSGKKIRKIFVTGHGMPGEVYGDLTGSIRLSSLGRLLAPLKVQTSDETETFLESCYLANDEAGKHEVQVFAHSVMGVGGRVKANRLQGMARLSPSALQQFVSVFNSAYNTFWMPRMLPITLVVNTTVVAGERSDQNQEAKKRGLEEVPFGESTIYEYRVQQ